MVWSDVGAVVLRQKASLLRGTSNISAAELRIPSEAWEQFNGDPVFMPQPKLTRNRHLCNGCKELKRDALSGRVLPLEA